MTGPLFASMVIRDLPAYAQAREVIRLLGPETVYFTGTSELPWKVRSRCAPLGR